MTSIGFLHNFVVELNIIFDGDGRSAYFEVKTSELAGNERHEYANINQAIKQYDLLTDRLWNRSIQLLLDRKARVTTNVVGRAYAKRRID